MRMLAASLLLVVASPAFPGPDKADKPKLSVKVNPSMAVAPARVVASADLTGGAPDSEELYCPAIEWDWGDDTRSTTSADCDPYQAGKSEIRRRFTADHVYQMGGTFRIQLRLTRKNKAIVSAGTSVQIRPGIGG
jgi:hypothetical protein